MKGRELLSDSFITECNIRMKESNIYQEEDFRIEPEFEQFSQHPLNCFQDHTSGTFKNLT